MPYTTQTWTDRSLATPLVSARLQHLEAGVAAVNLAFTPHTWTDGATPILAARLNDVEHAIGGQNLAYTQTTWTDGAAPELSATRFNALEAGTASLASAATDTYTRTIADGSGWGTANVGGAWSVMTNSSVTKFGVAGGVGRVLMNNAAPMSEGMSLPVAHTDANLLVSFSFSTLAVGGVQAVQAELRGTGTALGPVYRFRVDSDPTSAFAILRIYRLDSLAVATQLASRTTAVTLTAGVSTWLRCAVVGTSLMMRVWASGAAEGAAWDMSVTDATLTSGTAVRLRGQTLTGNTNLPTVSFDNLQVSAT